MPNPVLSIVERTLRPSSEISELMPNVDVMFDLVPKPSSSILLLTANDKPTKDGVSG